MDFGIYTLTPYFIAIVRYLLAGLFIVASIQKIRRPKLFIATVRSYKLLPLFAVGPFGFGLPWFELVLGILLCIGWYTKLAAALTGLLYLSFTVAIGINLARGRKDLDCGCFGPKKKHIITRWLVVRDIGLTLAASVVTMFGGGSFAFETLPHEAKGFLVHFLDEYVFPIALIFVGIVVASRLFKQALRLAYLSSMEQSG